MHLLRRAFVLSIVFLPMLLVLGGQSYGRQQFDQYQPHG